MREPKIETTDFPTFQQKVGKYNLSAYKMDMVYKQSDPRAWTAIINQGKDNVLVTYFINRNDYGDRTFDIITSNKTYYNIEQEDIYQTLDVLINKHSMIQQSPFEILN